MRGRDGRSVLDIYRERPQSYLGTCIAGYPNFFMFLGPFAAAGNQSALYMLEAQMAYIVDALRTMRARGVGRLEVREEVQDAFVSLAERRSVDTVWLTGGCRSYYQTPDGRNARPVARLELPLRAPDAPLRRRRLRALTGMKLDAADGPTVAAAA